MSKSISIRDVFKEIEKSDQSVYHRGKSWEHCYTFFRKYKTLRNDKLLVDYAALHLGFFLASWGMLRGSSFLNNFLKKKIETPTNPPPTKKKPK